MSIIQIPSVIVLIKTRFDLSGRLLPCKYDFIRVKSYEGMHSSGEVKITGLSDDEIAALAGKNVIFVEDIIDTGLTMKRLMNFMKEKVNPASVRYYSI